MAPTGSNGEGVPYVEYDVRQLVVGSHLLLFTIDVDRRKVWVIGLRHAHRLPRPGDLPADQGALKDGDENG